MQKIEVLLLGAIGMVPVTTMRWLRSEFIRRARLQLKLPVH